MEIERNGSRPSGKGPADYFTGTVRIDPLFQAADPARASGASVTFEPGAIKSATTNIRAFENLEKSTEMRPLVARTGIACGRGDLARRRSR